MQRDITACKRQTRCILTRDTGLLRRLVMSNRKFMYATFSTSIKLANSNLTQAYIKFLIRFSSTTSKLLTFLTRARVHCWPDCAITTVVCCLIQRLGLYRREIWYRHCRNNRQLVNKYVTVCLSFSMSLYVSVAVYFIYLHRRGYVMSGIRLSVCLSVSNFV